MKAATTTTVAKLFTKHFGDCNIEQLIDMGFLHYGHFFEELECRVRGGTRHEQVNAKGSDIVMPNGDLVEVKSLNLQTRKVKSRNKLRDRRAATINRLEHKQNCRLVIYIVDHDKKRVVRFELKAGWQDHLNITNGKMNVYVPVDADLLTHQGSGIFNSNLYHVKPVVIK